ncbi:MAG: hypothetical protein RSD67_05310 [Oscillospiraceae bacterium]
MQTLKNSVEVQEQINKVVEKAVEYVMLKADESLKNFLYQEGFEDGDGRGIYNAWDKNTAQIAKDYIEGTLKYNAMNLDLQQGNYPDKARHGSNMSAHFGVGDAPNDVREYFANIMFESCVPRYPNLGKAGGLRDKRDAWTPFIKNFDKNLEKWFVEGLRNQGVRDVIKGVSISKL